jgi:hypothetical protein
MDANLPTEFIADPDDVRERPGLSFQSEGGFEHITQTTLLTDKAGLSTDYGEER